MFGVCVCVGGGHSSASQCDAAAVGLLHLCDCFAVSNPQIVALREQNAHIQRKVASGEGGEDMLEASEAQQKVHGKVSVSAGTNSWWLLCPPVKL